MNLFAVFAARVEAALDGSRFDAVTTTAFEAVDALDCDLLVLGRGSAQ